MAFFRCGETVSAVTAPPNCSPRHAKTAPSRSNIVTEPRARPSSKAETSGSVRYCTPTAIPKMAANTAPTRHVTHHTSRNTQRNAATMSTRKPAFRAAGLRRRRLVFLGFAFGFVRLAAVFFDDPPGYRLSATKGGFRRRESLILRPARPLLPCSINA